MMVKPASCERCPTQDNNLCLNQAVIGVAWIAAITALAVGIISLLAQYNVISSSYDLVGKGVSWGISGGAVALLTGLIAYACWPESRAPSSSERAAPISPSAASPTPTRSSVLAALPHPPASAQGPVSSSNGGAAAAGLQPMPGAPVAASNANAAVPQLITKPYPLFYRGADPDIVTRSMLVHSFPNGLPTGLGTLGNPFRLGTLVFGHKIGANWGDPAHEDALEHPHNFYVEVSPGNYEWRIPPGYGYTNHLSIIYATILAVPGESHPAAPISKDLAKTFFDSLSVAPYDNRENRVTRDLLAHFTLHSPFGVGTENNPLRFGEQVFGQEINANWGDRPIESELEHPYTFYVEVAEGQYEWRIPPGCHQAPVPAAAE